MNGEKHRTHRALVAPALHKRYVEASYADIVEVTEQKLAGWHVGQRRDLFQEMKELTLAVAVKTFVGLDLGVEGKAMSRLLDQWIRLVFSLGAILAPMELPGLPYRRLLSTSEDLERSIQRLIDLRRAKGAGGHDVLSRLVQIHDDDVGRLNDEELIGQTNFLFMAGHATTACALTWTLFLLAQHPQVLSQVVGELEGKCNGSVPAREQLDALPSLDGVIKESLRLLPPVLWWSRVSTAAFALGPYELPSGTRLVHSVYITHRNAERFPEPDRFVPTRWFETAPGPFEYLPFSAGPRMCLGAPFALMELKLVIAIILQRWLLTYDAAPKSTFEGPCWPSLEGDCRSSSSNGVR